LAEMMNRSIHFRDLHPELADRFIDLNYSELVSNPMAVVSRIYQHLNRPLTKTTSEQMRQLIIARSRYRRRNSPAFSDLGLDVAAEIQRFREYCLRFGIPISSA